MKRPKQRTRKFWDYHECADYIGHKLGYDLRDTLSKFRNRKKDFDDTVEYRDFWHFMLKHNDVHNPCYVFIGDHMKDDAFQWQADIVEAFIQEFGETEYWVEW